LRAYTVTAAASAPFGPSAASTAAVNAAARSGERESDSIAMWM
jgi:hypothetical protein